MEKENSQILKKTHCEFIYSKKNKKKLQGGQLKTVIVQKAGFSASLRLIKNHED